jgi:Fur family ferric uptake transcriptional regulator
MPATSAAWVDHALSVLASRGYRAGGARSAVVEHLGRVGGCLTAEQVVAGLRGERRRVGAASVYRALNLLSDLGLLHRAALGDAPIRYDLVDPETEHHHHLVCDRCGRTVTFADSKLEAAIEDVSDRVGYVVDSHDVTLRGTCGDCAERGEAAGRPTLHAAG